MPLPLRLTTLVLPVVELLENVNVPNAAPTEVGLNCTCNVMAIVGFKVTGNVAPEKLNSAPVRLAALTVTGVVPVDVSVTDSVRAVLIGSSPKLSVLVLNVSTGLVVPVPLSVTVAVLPVDELLEIVTVPLAAPATVGLNVT